MPRTLERHGIRLAPPPWAGVDAGNPRSTQVACSATLRALQVRSTLARSASSGVVLANNEVVEVGRPAVAPVQDVVLRSQPAARRVWCH